MDIICCTESKTTPQKLSEEEQEEFVDIICCTESKTTPPYYKAIDCDCEEE
tara:strand:- start:999 stop:1151 length:153 start_codon:yes stop_codon:yes gene_type:complete